MGKNKKNRAIVINGVMLTGCAYGCYAKFMVLRWLNRLANTEWDLSEWQKKASVRRTQLKEDGYSKEQIKDLMSFYVDMIKDTKDYRSDCISSVKSFADYYIPGGQDVFGWETPGHTGNVFDDMFKSFTLCREIYILDCKRLAMYFGLAKDPAFVDEVATDLYRVMSACLCTVSWYKKIGKVDKDGCRNVRGSMIKTKEIESAEDLVLLLRAVLVEFWKHNRHFAFHADGTFTWPDWCVVDDCIDESTEEPEDPEIPEDPESTEDPEDGEIPEDPEIPESTEAGEVVNDEI